MEDRAPALEGMVSTVLKYSKVTDVAKYLSSSKKLKKATLMKIKKEAQEYEKSNENFIRSLSIIIALRWRGHWKGKVHAREVCTCHEAHREEH